MQMSKTHWRATEKSNFAASWDFDQRFAATIKKVENKVVTLSGGRKEEKTVVTFEEKEISPGHELKPMILNAYNKKALVKITGSPYIEDWSGCPVWISKRQVKFQGDDTEGLKLEGRTPSPICTPEQMEEITERCKNIGRTTEQLCGYLGIPGLHTMTLDDYSRAVDALDSFEVKK
jgi:hypothetical protein